MTDTELVVLTATFILLILMSLEDMVIEFRRYKRLKGETVDFEKLSKLKQIDRRILFTVYPPIEAVISKFKKSPK